MRLRLTNFKCYLRTVEFEFKDATLNLLTGNSNCGKTTIFDAIYWCLYGSVRSVYPKGEKPSIKQPTVVVIEMQDYSIKRSKPPDVIEVTLSDGRVLAAEAAQDWIDINFGTKTTFLATTYMKQKKESPLLDAKTLDRSELLQELTFGKVPDAKTREDPGFYLERVDAEIKTVKQQLAILTGRIDVLTEQFNTKQKNSIASAKLHPDGFTVTDLSQLDLRLSKVDSAIAATRKHLTSTRKRWAARDAYVKSKQDLLTQQQALDAQIEDFRHSIPVLEAHIKLLASNKKYDSRHREMTAATPTAAVCEFMSINYKHLTQISEYLTRRHEFAALMSELRIRDADQTVEKIDAKITELESIVESAKFQESKQQQYLQSVKVYELLCEAREELLELAKLRAFSQSRLDAAMAAEAAYLKRPEVSRLIDVVAQTLPVDPDLAPEQIIATVGIKDMTAGLTKLAYDYDLSQAALVCPSCQEQLDYHSGKLLPHHTKRRDCISREDITAAQATLANLAANAKTTRVVAQKIAGLKPEQPIPELPVPPDAPVFTSHLSSKDLLSLKRTLRRLQSLRHPGSMTEVLGRQYDDSELAMFVKQQSTYKKYTELCQEVRGLKHFPPELKLSEAEATAQLAQLRALHAKVDYVAESLDELEAVPEPDVTLEQLESELAALEADREQQRELRKAGLQLLELNEAADTRNEAIAKTEALLVRQVGLDKIKHLISETVSHALETTVDTINSVLADISNELYDDGTVIAFSMFKQLKTKDYIKAQPNVQITRGTDPDSILSYDVEELSGGEKSRLSLALALALAATCSTPFLFIDEGMSSMDPSLRERCMKIISAYTPNKIVINVCHGIVEGFHGHVVDLNL